MADIKRPNYFTYQFLVEKDFDDEQAYHLQMRRSHNSLLHAWGVADGFEVTRTGASEVRVGVGAAVDKNGREIVLVEAQTHALVTTGNDIDVYLTIGYQEVYDSADRYTQGGVDNFTRVTERPLLQDSAAVPPADGSVIVLAKIRLNASGTIESVGAIDVGVRRPASATLAPQSVNTLHIADGSITAAKLAPNAVGDLIIADGSIKTAELADGAVTAAKIADGNVGTGELANLAVTTTKIADGAVTAGKIADETVGTAELANLSVTNAKLADASVGTTKLTDATVTLAKLALNSVDGSKIVNGSIGTAELADASVSTEKLADASVTLVKLASNSVDASKIVDASIGTTELANGAVTLAKIAANSVDALRIVDGSVGTTEIANSAITNPKLADGAVTRSKLSMSCSYEGTDFSIGANSSHGFGLNGGAGHQFTLVSVIPKTPDLRLKWYEFAYCFKASTGEIITGRQLNVENMSAITGTFQIKLCQMPL